MKSLAFTIHRLLPFTVLLLLLFIFFWQIIFQNHTFISSGMILTDLYLFNYPLKSLLHQSLLSGQGVPFWTDLIGNGYPIFAEGQMGALYPVHLLLFSLPVPTVSLFNINILLHLYFAAIGVYLYASKYINIEKKASILSSVIFMYSGYVLTHLHQVNIILVISYFPWNLVLIEGLLHRINKEKALIAIMATTLILYSQINAGHIEMVYYNLMFSIIYGVIRLVFDMKTRQNALQGVGVFLIAGIIAGALSAPQLTATFELVQFSQREEGLSYEHTTGALWPIETLILFINPKAYNVYRDEPGYNPAKSETVNIGALYPYVGTIPLLLALSSPLLLLNKHTAGARKKWILIYLSLVVFTYIYAIGRSTQLFAVVWETIPGLKYFRFPIKSIYIIEFSLAILAGVSYQSMEDIVLNKGKRSVSIRNTKDVQIVENRSSEIGSKGTNNEPLFGNRAGNNELLSGKTKLAFIGGVVIILISFLDLYINNGPIQPTIPATSWLKQPDFASFIHTQEGSDPNVAIEAKSFVNWRSYSHGTNNIDYTRIFDFKLQKDLQNILHVDFNMIHNIAINREWAVLFLQRQTLLNNRNTQINTEQRYLTLPTDLKKSLDLQSVRYLMTDLEIKNDQLNLVKTKKLSSAVNHVVFMAGEDNAVRIPTDTLYLYENKTYSPRINIIPEKNVKYMSATDKSATNILQEVMSSQFDPTNNAIIETIKPTKSEIPDTKQNLAPAVKVLKYKPSELIIATETDEPGYVTLSDTYYPGWTATVDSQPTEVTKANYAFRAVHIPAGKHIVTMSFVPTHWKESMLVAAVAAGIIALLFVSAIFINLKRKMRSNIN